MIEAFVYPKTPHVRRHGPCGYKDYESYRDWLRDDFRFRCVYCLHRERWGGIFHIDHMIPVVSDPGKECDYANLLYSCDRCNLSKSDMELPIDPGEITIGQCLRIVENGEIQALNQPGKELVKLLRPNTDERRCFRRSWIATLESLRTSDPDLLREWLSFPNDLPDLRTKRTENTKPGGMNQCFFVLRESGTLPDTY